MKKLLSIRYACCLLLLAAAPLAAQPAPIIKLGIAYPFGSDANDEFMHYSPFARDLKAQGLQASLFDDSLFTDPGVSADALYQALKRFHVVHIRCSSPNIFVMTPQLEASARQKGEALARYVREGGGLFLAPSLVRYLHTDIQDYWNLLLQPMGVTILNEGLGDKTRTYKTETEWGGDTSYWYTTQISPHPITAGITSLWFPWGANAPLPTRGGTAAMQYSDDWQVIVRGEKEAQSYKEVERGEWQLDPNQIGTYQSAPPVVAVRQLGKGRIVCYPVTYTYSLQEYGLKFWKAVVESRGNGTIPGNGFKLQVNAYKWLAQPCLADPTFGTFQAPPFQKIAWPASVSFHGFVANLPQQQLTTGPGVRGILGAHTAYSDGSGTVADYVRAAKAAGLSFIVFTDPLEKLTPAKLADLKKDCAAASDASFYACPGVEFTDLQGNRWALWGEKIAYPPASFKDGNTTYTQWDGQRIHQYGDYVGPTCGFMRGCALISFSQLRADGCHPENLWWYFYVFPFAYDQGKLIADNMPGYLSELRDLRWLSVASFTRIYRPDQVRSAARTCVTVFPSLAQARVGLGQTCSDPGDSGYVSQGPEIAQWAAVNSQMDNNWHRTRGAQRVICRFVVRAAAGIADVKVLDADQGVVRRFAGNGATELTRQFELVHDRQHYLVLQVTDKNGKQAISPYKFVFSYGEGEMRCGDDLNTQDTGGDAPTHPDREQLVFAAPNVQNGLVEIMDRDGPQPLYPLPMLVPETGVQLQGLGLYPDNEWNKGLAQSVLLDFRMASTQVCIDAMHLDKLSDYGSPDRAPTALGWVNRDAGENQYFARTTTDYFLRDRANWYAIWGSPRRPQEGFAKYQGGLEWQEGTIRFKKDCVLDGAVPIPLVRMICPRNKDLDFGGTLVVTDAKLGQRTVTCNPQQDVTVTGKIAPGGYASQLPCGEWYYAFFAPPGSDFSYSATLPKDWNDAQWQGDQLYIGLGHPGEKIKAGTVLKYAFATALFYDKQGGKDILTRNLLAPTAQALNMGGGHAGYPVQMEVGSLVDATVFFTAQAADHEAAFSLGPRNLIVDLPIKVEGLEDNGCAAVYSTVRPWFRFVPVYQGTAYFQEPITAANRMWVGNPFVCDNPAVRLTLVVDGQAAGKNPRLEVHNPTDQPIAATISSPPHTPLFGGISGKMTVPAGDSVWVEVAGKKLVPAP